MKRKTYKVDFKGVYVLTAFSIYFGFFFVVHIIFNLLSQPNGFEKDYSYIYLILKEYSFVILICLLIGYFYTLPNAIRIEIFKRSKSTFAHDVKVGVICAIFSYLLMQVCSFLFYFIMTHIFDITLFPDQIVVEYLKAAKDNLVSFIAVISSIIFFVTIIEELLFRGFLQTWLKKKFNVTIAIIISSFFFSILHFSIFQGWSNLIIVGMLFLLSIFIGVLYEREKSLVPVIILHILFNSISLLNLFFVKEI